MPILGVVASSISGNLFSASYESISTVTVGAGGTGSIVFSSIPNGYTHLQIRMTTRGDQAFASRSWFLLFNGDFGTTTNAWHWLGSDGSSASATASANQTYVQGIDIAASSTANVFNTAVIDILDYANTNKNKTLRALNGYDANGTGTTQLVSGFYSSLNAVNQITVAANGQFVQHSKFALYGIKGVA
jgi:hypothetical protein